MSAGFLFSVVIAYFILLLVVALKTSKGSDNESFFIGNRKSNWMLVAFGMIGTSLSGVTFVSVPGAVGMNSFAYMQIVFGYFIGYLLIAFVLLPLYYRLKLTSIYSYLKTRMGMMSYKTGAWFFIISRLLGATARLYLVVVILQTTILDSFGIPFWVSTLFILIMIILYTFEGGVKTIVWTDTLQTTGMLTGLIAGIIFILHNMGISVTESLDMLRSQQLSRVFHTDMNSTLFWPKQILAGMFITLSMTGLDQEMMQKSISVTNLRDSKKNMVSLAFIMLVVIGLFLYMGGLLYLYGQTVGGAFTEVVNNGVPAKTFMLDGKNVMGDSIFPQLAVHHMPHALSIIFIIALISALFPSADGAMTALTSSFCIDIAGINRNPTMTDKEKKRFRQRVHLTFALLFLLFVMVFYWIGSRSIIDVILKIAGYTYGPLLGLFAFGIFVKRRPVDKLVPIICFAAPIISFVIDEGVNKMNWLGGYKIGLELIIINAALAFIGLFFISKKVDAHELEQDSVL
ncbi:MAG TPA: sodium:solute symporter [Niabella sp.]|nr:sodium:solute symporter [Chitinophagaceae bacterium]HRO84085.1 sodium:solute symporter [Niabella sp.]